MQQNNCHSIIGIFLNLVPTNVIKDHWCANTISVNAREMDLIRARVLIFHPHFAEARLETVGPALSSFVLNIGFYGRMRTPIIVVPAYGTRVLLCAVLNRFSSVHWGIIVVVTPRCLLLDTDASIEPRTPNVMKNVL